MKMFQTKYKIVTCIIAVGLFLLIAVTPALAQFQRVIEDFRVNDDPLGNNRPHMDPVIACDSKGCFVIAWQDARNGTKKAWDYDIYAQRYDSGGQALGANFRVNDDGPDNYQTMPQIAMSDSGEYIIVWTDGRNDFDIYAQRYDRNGNTIGTNFQLNEFDSATQAQGDIGLDSIGGFVVAWRDDRNGNGDIYVRRFNADGTAKDTSCKVNDDTVNTLNWYPRIAVGRDGRFIVTWEDYRREAIGYVNPDMYAQRYNNIGSKIGGNWLVNTDAGDNNQGVPVVAISRGNNFVISWSDARPGGTGIYAQWYDSAGAALGINFKVSDSSIINTSDVAYDSIGNFLICWEQGDYDDLFAQRYNNIGLKIGNNFNVDDIPLTSHVHPAVTSYSESNYIFTWQDSRSNGNWDIWANKWGNYTGVEGIPDNSYNVKEIKLSAYPNPCIDKIILSYDLPYNGLVSISIYDIIGRKIKTLYTGWPGVGCKSNIWHLTNDQGKAVGNGIYLCDFKFNGQQIVKRITVMR